MTRLRRVEDVKMQVSNKHSIPEQTRDRTVQKSKVRERTGSFCRADEPQGLTSFQEMTPTPVREFGEIQWYPGSLGDNGAPKLRGHWRIWTRRATVKTLAVDAGRN